jgi:hypothetical protein
LSRFVFVRWRNDYNSGAAIGLVEHHVDSRPGLDMHSLADDVGMNRKLSSTAIDEHRKRNSRGSSKISELVQCSADRAPGIKNVVDDYDVRAFDIAGQARRANYRARPD